MLAHVGFLSFFRHKDKTLWHKKSWHLGRHKKEEKKNNGEAEAVQVDRDSDQENVRLPFTFQDYYYADRGQMNPNNILHHKTRPKNPKSYETALWDQRGCKKQQ
jgi:hypothetical protein